MNVARINLFSFLFESRFCVACDGLFSAAFIIIVLRVKRRRKLFFVAFCLLPVRKEYHAGLIVSFVTSRSYVLSNANSITSKLAL